jgi:DNA-binding PadR family transcriptional regulator
VSVGAVQATLRRLESKGLLTSQLGDPLAERGGKARRFFAPEPQGLDAFHDAARAFTAVIEAAR